MTASSSTIPPFPPSPAFPQSVGIRQKPMAPSALKADWRNTNKSGRPVSTGVFPSITAGRTGGSSGWRNVDPSLHRQRKASLQAAAKRDRAAPSPAPRGCRPGWRNNKGIRSRRCRTRRHPHSPHTCTRPSVARDGHQGGIRPPARQAHGRGNPRGRHRGRPRPPHTGKAVSPCATPSPQTRQATPSEPARCPRRAQEPVSGGGASGTYPEN